MIIIIIIVVGAVYYHPIAIFHYFYGTLLILTGDAVLYLSYLGDILYYVCTIIITNGRWVWKWKSDWVLSMGKTIVIWEGRAAITWTSTTFMSVQRLRQTTWGILIRTNKPTTTNKRRQRQKNNAKLCVWMDIPYNNAP